MAHRWTPFDYWLRGHALPCRRDAIHPVSRASNGRIGRLLIPLFLIERGVLPSPLLYLSVYFDASSAGLLRPPVPRSAPTGEWSAAGTGILPSSAYAEQSEDAISRDLKCAASIFNDLTIGSRLQLPVGAWLANAADQLADDLIRWTARIVTLAQGGSSPPRGYRRLALRLIVEKLEEVGITRILIDDSSTAALHGGRARRSGPSVAPPAALGRLSGDRARRTSTRARRPLRPLH